MRSIIPLCPDKIVRSHAGFGKERQEKKMLPTDN